LSKEECFQWIAMSNYRLSSTIQDIVTRHLDSLNKRFMHYFPNEMRDTEHIAWVSNPFEVDFSKLSLSSETD